MDLFCGGEDGLIREWTPCTHMINSIPLKIQTGLFSSDLCLTCLDAVDEYIAFGTNAGLVYWYNRKTSEIQRLRCEKSQGTITYVKIADSVDYMVAAGNVGGQVAVFQVPKKVPDSLPDSVKPKAERKVERYTVDGMHNGPITTIEWSKNGMKIFSGDVNGVIVHTEIDFYMHLCKSVEIVNETHEIVQMSYWQGKLLISSIYRSILCEKKNSKWEVSQIGNKERKSLCRLGGIFKRSVASPNASIFCARPGQRLWSADSDGNVLQTFLFKDAVNNPSSIVELLNPSQNKHSIKGKEFGPLHIFKENLIVTYNEEILYILDPRTLTAVAVIDNLRRIHSVCVSKEEMFVLEGPRSVVRIAYSPDVNPKTPDDSFNLMTKSLTGSLHKAMTTVRDLTHLDQTVPFITNILEQPISALSQLSEEDCSKAEECFELPPIKSLPEDVNVNILNSIVSEYRDINYENYKVKTEDLNKKLRLYNEIMKKTFDEDVIHSRGRHIGDVKNVVASNQSEKVDLNAKADDQFVRTTPLPIKRLEFESTNSESLENLQREIENKEKRLAKMLNLESLSIPSKNDTMTCDSPPKQIALDTASPPRIIHRISPVTVNRKEEVSRDIVGKLVPEVAKIPKNWNLETLQFDANRGMKKNVARQPQSPDSIETDWVFV